MNCVETIETKWKNVMDMKMNDNNDCLLGLSLGNNGG